MASNVVVFPPPRPKSVPTTEELVAQAARFRTRPVPPPIQALADAITIQKATIDLCLDSIVDYETEGAEYPAVVARLVACSVHVLEAAFRLNEEVQS